MSLKLCENQPLVNKQTLLTELAQVLSFPEYFGHNWDAAWDCLTELSFEKGPIILELDLTGKSVDEHELAIFTELLDEASEYWQGEGQILKLNVFRA